MLGFPFLTDGDPRFGAQADDARENSNVAVAVSLLGEERRHCKVELRGHDGSRLDGLPERAEHVKAVVRQHGSVPRVKTVVDDGLLHRSGGTSVAELLASQLREGGALVGRHKSLVVVGLLVWSSPEGLAPAVLSEE